MTLVFLLNEITCCLQKMLGMLLSPLYDHEFDATQEDCGGAGKKAKELLEAWVGSRENVPFAITMAFWL